MERYSGTNGMEAVSVDPVPEWGGETGLEEPMWQLGLADGPESYPERPDESDCIYYLRTGFCGYGNRCRYNHPRDRTRAIRALRACGVEYPERFGQPVCQYYMRTGMCKYGASCKYHHPKVEVGSSAPVMLNIYGYPLRPGEKECSYYVRTGECKYVVSCKYNHPGPAPGPAVYPPLQSSQQYGGGGGGGVIPGNWTVGRPPMIPSSSYVPGNYGPVLLHPGVVPLPGWTPYPGPASPSTVGANPIYGIPQLSSSYISIAGPTKEHAFPERPDQPKCQYYLRTGDCKFGTMCKYHHPPDWTHMGIPSHPGAPLCTQYAQNGVCRFGPSCKFDHPMRSLSYNTSSSSLTNMSVAPYPIGSTNATLAPSSSSSDLRTSLLSSTKDA